MQCGPPPPLTSSDPSIDITNLVEFNLGGTPLQAGRVGNKYYLIVSPAR